jgi:nicotinamide riboside transporter PnuC
MSRGCFASAHTSCPGSSQWTGSKRIGPSPPYILPGIVGNLPASFATFAAYWDLATGVLAMLALLTVRRRPLFWLFVVAFNLVGVIDLILDYYHAVRVGLPAMAGQLGATYVIPIIYVPLLMITHVVALYWLVRRQPKAARALAGNAVAA